MYHLWYYLIVMAKDKKHITVIFFKTESGKEPAREWLQDLSFADRKEIGKDLQDIEYSYPLGMPLVKKLEKDLWEVRSTLTEGTARIVFTVYDKKMILLHGFKKKTQKIEKKDIELARTRLKHHKEKRK